MVIASSQKKILFERHFQHLRHSLVSSILSTLHPIPCTKRVFASLSVDFGFLQLPSCDNYITLPDSTLFIG